MLEGKYCKIVNKITGKIIASGKIINHKDIPVQCITFDNRYYFNTCKHLFYKFIYSDYCEEIPFNNEKHKRMIKKWSSSPFFRFSLVFREYDINELDEEIKDLVFAINKIGIRTVSSCCGHGRTPAWVHISFERFSQIRKIIDILNMKDFNKKFVLTTNAILLNNNQNEVLLSLQTTSIGKTAYNDVKELSKFINMFPDY